MGSGGSKEGCRLLPAAGAPPPGVPQQLLPQQLPPLPQAPPPQQHAPHAAAISPSQSHGDSRPLGASAGGGGAAEDVGNMHICPVRGHHLPLVHDRADGRAPRRQRGGMGFFDWREGVIRAP